MLRRAERLHGQFFRPTSVGTPRTAWEPPVDIFETDTEFLIDVALPGVAPAEIGIEIEAGSIVVSCKRSAGVGSGIRTVHRIEIPHGRFERRISLPPGRWMIARHETFNGCLRLRLRKG